MKNNKHFQRYREQRNRHPIDRQRIVHSCNRLRGLKNKIKAKLHYTAYQNQNQRKFDGLINNATTITAGQAFGCLKFNKYQISAKMEPH